MISINWKQIYEVEANSIRKWILILYDISQNHYVGISVYNNNQNNSMFIRSINKYIVLDEINDYNKSSIKKCIYIKGKPLKITNREFDNILSRVKDYLLKYIKDNTKNNPS